jgi:hypothetical protein
MTNKTESIVENTPFDLENIQTGAMVTITQDNLTAYVVWTGPLPGQYAIANGTPPQGAISTFVLTVYGWSEGLTKVSLQPFGMDGYYWTAGQNVEGIAYPITLGPEQETFILAETIDEYTTIQYTVTPPGPYIHGYDSGAKLLTYGHDQPLIQGLFEFQIVG